MIVRDEDFKATQEILRSFNAPVFVRRNFRTGKIVFLRKPTCTPKQVADFWNFICPLEKLNDTSTNNQRNVNEQC